MRWSPARTRALGLLGVPAVFLAACAPPPIDDGSYALVFQDDFAATTVDPVWATAPFGGSLPATVDDGVLTISTTAANSYYWGYVASTGPRSVDEPHYRGAAAWQEGYFEARIRYTDDAWSWPAFWLFSMAKTEAWPDENCSRLNAEWNIMENGTQNWYGTRPARNWYFTALHRNTGDGTGDGYCGQPDEFRQFSLDGAPYDLSDWHVWGGLWTDGELCTYVDGVQVQCMEAYDSTAQPMHLVFTMQYLGQCDGCPPRPASLEMQVDWVRVWQRP